MKNPIRILVVDDDETIRKTVKLILEDEEYMVDLAVNGQEAISLSLKNSYNIALIDIQLPDIEGVTLLRLMKDSVPKVRKIMLTGYPSMQNAVKALNNNADAYLIKPVDVEKLLSTVKEQLEKQEEDIRFSQEKIAEFIESRIKDLSR